MSIAEIKCQRALANLILMAVCNIISDVALIIFPFPILQHLRLDLKTKFQLSFLFSVGAVVVAITILRLPLILNESVSQQSRSKVFAPPSPIIRPLSDHDNSGLPSRFYAPASWQTRHSSTPS